MTHEIATSKGTFLFVGQTQIGIASFVMETGNKIIGMLSQLTEDQAREVVEKEHWNKNGTHVQIIKFLMQENGINIDEFPDWLIIKVK